MLFQKLKRRTNLVIGILIVSMMIGMAVFAPFIAPYDPIHDANLLYSEEPPGKEFFFGTDTQGRDILSRVIYGARISLSVGLISLCDSGIKHRVKMRTARDKRKFPHPILQLMTTNPPGL